MYFWAGSWKIFCDIWNQYPQICLTAKFLKKTKTPKFGNKNALFWRFGQQCWKAIVIFEISNLEFAFLQSFVQKLNIIRFGNKNANFGARILKYYSHIWNQRPRICLLTKLEANTKIFKFGTKNTLFGYFFHQKCPIWVFLYNNLKSASSSLSNCKISGKCKMAKFGTENALFECFCARILTNYCHIWNRQPQSSVK